MNKLQKRVTEIVEENGGKDFANDVLQYGCQSGLVGELIYYNDTHKWYDEFYNEIEELREEYEEMLGEPLQAKGDLKNWFAWFSFEETVRKLYDDN